MKSILARVSVSASIFAMTALPVLADGSRRGGYGVRQNVNQPVPPPSGGGGVVHAPEIDASTGLLALGAVAVALVLVWELRRRRLAA